MIWSESKLLASRLGIWEEVELVSDAGQTKRFDKDSNHFSLVLPKESLCSNPKKRRGILEKNGYYRRDKG